MKLVLISTFTPPGSNTRPILGFLPALNWPVPFIHFGGEVLSESVHGQGSNTTSTLHRAQIS